MEQIDAPAVDRRGFDQSLGTSFGAPAIVVHPVLPGKPDAEARSPEAKLLEIEGLAAAIRLDVRDRELVRLRAMSPATLLGKGQLERLAAAVQAHEAEVVVVDSAITPIQQKNLEKALKA